MYDYSAPQDKALSGNSGFCSLPASKICIANYVLSKQWCSEAIRRSKFLYLAHRPVRPSPSISQVITRLKKGRSGFMIRPHAGGRNGWHHVGKSQPSHCSVTIEGTTSPS